MAQAEGYAAQIIADAEALLGKVQQDLDRAADFYRENGIDPAKVVPALEPYMGLKEVEELNRIMKEDQEAIQREVDEAAARLRFANAPTGGAAKRPRNMV